MPNIIFSESGNVNNALFGKVQTPIKAMILEQAEAFEGKSMIGELCAEVDSENFAELYTGVSSMGDWKPVGENGGHPTNGMLTGFEKEIRNTTWKSHFAISREMVDDSKRIAVEAATQGFTTSYYRTREKLLAQLYGAAMNGDATFKIDEETFSTRTADGEKLFSKVHKMKNGGKQCNMFSDAISSDALLYAESRLQDMRDDNGNILDIRPNTILIPNDPSAKKAVFAAIGADKDPDVASSNAFNYNYGRWNVIVWAALNPYIAEGNTPWCVLDTEYMKNYYAAVFQNRVGLEITSKIADNDANVWNGYSRFSAGFVDYRFIVGCGMGGGEKLLKV